MGMFRNRDTLCCWANTTSDATAFRVTIDSQSGVFTRHIGTGVGKIAPASPSGDFLVWFLGFKGCWEGRDSRLDAPYVAKQFTPFKLC